MSPHTFLQLCTVAVIAFLAAPYVPNHWKFWREKPKEPAVPDVCAHVWGNWSAPEILKIVENTSCLWMEPVQTTERVTEGLKQERTCELCNLYERRLVP